MAVPQRGVGGAQREGGVALQAVAGGAVERLRRPAQRLLARQQRRALPQPCSRKQQWLILL